MRSAGVSNGATYALLDFGPGVLPRVAGLAANDHQETGSDRYPNRASTATMIPPMVAPRPYPR